MYTIIESAEPYETLLIEYAPVEALQLVLYEVIPATRKVIRFELPSHTDETVEPSSEYTRPDTVIKAEELSQPR